MGTRMWKTGAVVLLAAAICASAASEKSAVILPSNNIAADWGGGGYTSGWEFSLTQNIIVAQLGLALAKGDALLENQHQVLLYDSGGNVLASTTFGPGDINRDTTDWYAYNPLASGVVLPPGTYVVAVYAAAVQGDPHIRQVTGEVFDPMISVMRKGLYTSGSGPAMPVTDGSSSGYEFLGASFKFELAVTNQTPVIDSVTIEPAAIGTASQVIVAFSDTDASDTHTATINWGDNTETTFPAVSPVTASHTYAATGVYTVTVTVSDGTDASDSSTAFAPVYDPTAGFVTGGGWVVATEKANFGFVCKYLKGATTPSGQLQFKDGNLNFHSTTYDWLVVLDNGTAQFAGVGTINGEGSYYFVVDVSDEPDEFRIDIWDYPYDSGLLPLGGGQIKVHQK